ncbi:MAG: GxxExxY protein [Candidatus Sumerlaeota bacterium]|nr:GxxExxY protein [Candidatus Sumerlaeota bacterium]
MLHEQITEKIIKVFYKVYNTLGYGFLEKVYENAMMIELHKMGFSVRQQQNIRVYYEGREVGDYYADIVVDNLIILELKAADALAPENAAQLQNYLRATDIEVGLLFNFGEKPQFERVIFTNDRKNRKGK